MFERFVEERIREAIAQGEFDNLPGRGQAVDLNAYFQMPAESRVAFALLRNHHIAPEEVQLLREMAGLRAQLETHPDETARRQPAKTLQEKQMAFNLLMEQRKRKS